MISSGLKSLKILYICTHNRCRSILSEAITNTLAGDLITARSAGSQPSDEVHPLSLKYLDKAGYRTDGLTSESWDDFENFQPDIVITVCDFAAGEACPLYFGDSIKFHWGLEDPSKLKVGEGEQEQAFRACIEEIEQRVQILKIIIEQNHDNSDLRDALLALEAAK